MIIDLAKALEKSTVQCLEDRVAIAFSGGLDSATLAAIAKKNCETFLFCAGTEDSDDLASAEIAARELSLPLEKIILDEKSILELYGKIHSFYPGVLPKIEIGIPILAACEAAKKKELSAILFGTGAEELFVGYERYYGYFEEGKDLEKILRNEYETLKDKDMAMVKKIAYKCNLEARFPFYDKQLSELVFKIPLEERMAERELKKGILREMGKMLGTPASSLKRKKKAAQYGSGVHRIVMRHADELNIAFPKKA